MWVLQKNVNSREINDANDMNLYENYIPLYHARKNNIWVSV